MRGRAWIDVIARGAQHAAPLVALDSFREKGSRKGRIDLMHTRWRLPVNWD